MKAATDFYASADNADRFQSTPPVKAATSSVRKLESCRDISIHAAREGGDRVAHKVLDIVQAISIHAAREGGDAVGLDGKAIVTISIHAAREGGDPCPLQHRVRTGDFNPRRP